jgi:hypothetical protein
VGAGRAVWSRPGRKRGTEGATKVVLFATGRAVGGGTPKRGGKGREPLSLSPSRSRNKGENNGLLKISLFIKINRPKKMTPGHNASTALETKVPEP